MPSSTEITTAVRSADVAQVAQLISYPDADVCSLDEDGHSALHWAAMTDTPSILALVLSRATQIDVLSTAIAQKDQTPLHWACVSGHTSTVQLLLQAGADPTLADANGYNAAIHSAQYGRVDVLHLLVSHNSQLLHSIDAKGHTLIQWASYYDHHPIITYLLVVHNVDPDLPDHASVTPLHRAAQRDHYMVISVLLRNGADVHSKNAGGKTARELAAPGTRSRKLLDEWEIGKLSTTNPVANRKTPRRYFLVCFYYILGFLSYLKYQHLVTGKGVLSGTTNLFLHCLLVVSISTHYMATFWDPGELQKGSKQEFINYLNKCIQEGTSETRMLPSSYCYTCLTVRPLRSKHSRERDACVRVFDHECPWVNNTVGLYTHKPLIIFAFSTAILECLFIYVVLFNVYQSALSSSIRTAIIDDPYGFFLALTHVGLMIFCTLLFATHVQLVVQGRTTYEMLVATKEKRSTEQNPFDKGMWNNVVAFVTSTGPGTGIPLTKMSISTLIDVVFSSGQSNSGNNRIIPDPTSTEQTKLLVSEEIV